MLYLALLSLLVIVQSAVDFSICTNKISQTCISDDCSCTCLYEAEGTDIPVFECNEFCDNKSSDSDWICSDTPSHDTMPPDQQETEEPLDDGRVDSSEDAFDNLPGTTDVDYDCDDGYGRGSSSDSGSRDGDSHGHHGGHHPGSKHRRPCNGNGQGHGSDSSEDEEYETSETAKCFGGILVFLLLICLCICACKMCSKAFCHGKCRCSRSRCNKAKMNNMSINSSVVKRKNGYEEVEGVELEQV